MSESNVNVEKDETLNAETAAVENVAETVENKSTEIEETVVVENQVEEAKTQEPEPKPEQPETQPEVTEEKETLPAEEPKVEEPVAEVKEEPQPETPAEEITEEKPEEKSEEKTEETVEEKLEEPVEEQPAMDFSALGKEQLVEQLEKLMSMPVESVKERVAQIKGAFFALRKEEISKEKAAFVENGNDEEAFVAQEDEIELKIKELLAEFKEKRAEFNAEQEAVKQANLDKKNKIIEEIRTISQDTDNINRQFSHVQQLQQEFKAIGEVPSTSTTEVWKAYQAAIENFYDLLKINKDLRDYDFKKNLEIKQQLCEQAESLDEETDVIAAFKALQALHDKWRETGPVAKEIREQVWARFKTASAVINKKHQAFFEERKASEKENADAKTALCEEIEKIDTSGLKTYAAWDEATKQIIALQEEWKKLGFASRKVNTSLYNRFRKSCDEFFEQKAAFFKTMKEELASNLAKKTELCEKAEALKDSTDWKETSDALIALQKEWKTIGPVVKRHSDAVWKRFITACDYFFEQKKKQTSSQRSVEHENLKAKKELIAQVNAILESEEEVQDAPQKIRDLMSKWQTIGHVPFKEKDKIYAAYKEAIDKAFEKFDMKAIRTRLSNFENTMNQSGSDKVYHEREKLVRVYEQKCSELKTYENNMGFFNATSKSGNSIVKEMERKIANLKDEIALLEQKIKIIDEKI
ncbi:MAG: DUF349 domain-containing protein [Muribaculaceae bacterium]|nr:DUF349 domain-containing protein [Muribaculaceae bacterium]